MVQQTWAEQQEGIKKERDAIKKHEDTVCRYDHEGTLLYAARYPKQQSTQLCRRHVGDELGDIPSMKDWDDSYIIIILADSEAIHCESWAHIAERRGE